MYKLVTTMPRPVKWAILLGMDVLLVPIALLAAFALHYNIFWLSQVPLINGMAMSLLMGMTALLGIVTNTYRIQLKAYETRAMMLTALQTVLLGVSVLLLDRMAQYGTDVAVIITFMMIYFLGAVAGRVLLLQILLAIHRAQATQCRVLVYGAGTTGRQLVAALRTDDRINPVGFIDDNNSLHGMIVRGLRVHSPQVLSTLIRRKKVDRVLIAMPSLSRPRIIQLSQKLEELGVDVQTLPSFAQLAQHGTLVDQLESVVPSQFLGRDALDRDLSDGLEAYEGRTVMISGAGGSIGSELCRQLLPFRPAKIVLFEFSELALYTIEMELQALTKGTGVQIEAVLGSVTDQGLVASVLKRHQVQVVLHAAAYKHVPIVEKNMIVGVSNNILGTQSIATAAGEAGVERFILVSTDKAVRPTNAMGASKRMAEVIVQDLARRASEDSSKKTIYSIVRFGNVIGSSGSVIPLFEDQIRRGGPVTLTHRNVTRYFMTIPEAAALVLMAGSLGGGGDIFVLDMGNPVSIHALARQMIEAAGYRVRDENTPDGDIEIQLTGLRPGEKMHEELMIGEGEYSTIHPKIMRAREDQLSEIEVAAALKAIRAAVEKRDEVALRAALIRSARGIEPAAPAVLDRTSEKGRPR